jgi:hypothetical protein
MRAPLKAPEPRSREQIEADVLADLQRYFPGRRFYDHLTGDLVHWHAQYQQHAWTPKEILAARRNPVFQAYGLDFGATRPPKPWMLMACTFVGLMRDATGKEGYGRADGPLISFVHQQLVRIMGAHAVPAPATIRSSFQQRDQ